MSKQVKCPTCGALPKRNCLRKNQDKCARKTAKAKQWPITKKPINAEQTP